MKNKYLGCLVLLLFAVQAFAQERAVSGKVTDAEDGSGVPGVNILVKGTSTGTITDFEGNYKLNVPENATLVFSYIGYQPQEVTVGARAVIDVSLELDVQSLSEVVVVGYGTQEKKDVTGSMATISEKDFNRGAITSPEELIQGRAAGVQISSANGEPGAGVSVRIRGGTSINAGNEPLYVIDGVPIDNSATDPSEDATGFFNSGPRNPLAMLNPADIASIDVLKDASAAAIYGSRGANGVVIITTKRGKEGVANVSYDSYMSVATIANKLDLLTADEYRDFINANGLSAAGLGNANTDWQDEITRTALTHSHNVSLSGGTAKQTYRVSVGYFDQEGIVINSGVERVTGRINMTQKAFNDKLNVGLNLTTSYIKNNNTPYQQTGGFEGGLFTNVFKYNPTFPVRNPDGSFNEVSAAVRNPVALAELIDDFTQTTRVLGNFFLEYELAEGLKVKQNLGVDRSASSRRIFQPRALPFAAGFGGRADISHRDRSSVLSETTFNYVKTQSNGNTLNILGGYSYQEFQFEQVRVTGQGFPTDAFATFNLEGASDLSVAPTSRKEKNQLISFIARVNYDIQGKYLVTATYRRDGSSRFGENNKWGDFPSVSFAWRLSEEEFIKNTNFFTDLKFRAGWGITGSQEIGNLLSQNTLVPEARFRALLGNNEILTGVANSRLANPDLKWEETSQFNFGIDFGILEGKLSGTIDYYIKDTEDLLIVFDVPQPAPVETFIDNAGEVRNRGIELTLQSVNVDNGNFKWTTNFNIARNTNEVLSVGSVADGARETIFTGRLSGAGVSDANFQIIRVGEPLGTFFGPQSLGVDENGEEILSDERVILGNAQPDFTYGITNTFSYGNWDLSLFFQGVAGQQVYNNTALEYARKNNFNSNINLLAAALDDGLSVDAAVNPSGRFLEDAGFLRLNNVTVGYTLPTANIDWLNSLRLYVSGQNLFVITDYTGFDPEVNTNARPDLTSPPALGIDYTNYPRARTFTFGLNAQF